MQVVKGDRNSQLRKDDGTHLRKNESLRKYGTKAKKHLSPRDGKELRGIPEPVDAMGDPAGSHATPRQKKRRGKGRGQGPLAKDVPECRNTNDDDDDAEKTTIFTIIKVYCTQWLKWAGASRGSAPAARFLSYLGPGTCIVRDSAPGL